MTQEYAIFFVRAGAALPETCRGVWADNEAQARARFQEAMLAIAAWHAGAVTIIAASALPNPSRRYCDKDEAAYELHCTERGIDDLIAQGYLPKPERSGRWLCTWQELDEARLRRRKDAA